VPRGLTADPAAALARDGYTLEGPAYATGRPDRSTFAVRTRAGVPAVAKLYPSGGGEQTYANMAAVWRSSFGERRRPPGLPQPLDFVPEAGALIMERLPGRPLVELGPVREIDDVVPLLVALHESDAVPSKRRNWARVVRSAKRKAAKAEARTPDLGALFRETAEALAAVELADAELVAGHGDFTPRNVLAGPGRLALIDWDRFQLADPARDVAYFGAWCFVWSLRRGGPPDWTPLERTAIRYAELRPGSALEQRLPFHVAAGLVRIAHGIVELWPHDAPLVPRLLEAARRQLR
jgi:Ser/Thr protein kinase RdoA (MazF antagonist)